MGGNKKSVVSKAPSTPALEIDADEVKAKAAALLGDASAYWETVDEKPAVLAAGAGAVFALYVASGVLGFLHKIPLLPSLFELVGLTSTALFVATFVVPADGRAELGALASDYVGKARGLAADLGLVEDEDVAAGAATPAAAATTTPPTGSE